MTNLTISIDIENIKDADGKPSTQYTPSIIYNDGKAETLLPKFESLQLKWASGGRGKGLKADIKVRAPIIRKGRLEAVNQSFSIPEDLEDVIDLAKFVNKMPKEDSSSLEDSTASKPTIKVDVEGEVVDALPEKAVV